MTRLPIAILTPMHTDSGMELADSLNRPLAVPIGVGEAPIITSLLQGIRFEVPTLPEIMCSLLESVGVRLDWIEMRTAGGRWRARLHCVMPDGSRVMRDGRVSDALALAVYRKLGIRVGPSALESAPLALTEPIPEPVLACGSLPHIDVPATAGPSIEISTASKAVVHWDRLAPAVEQQPASKPRGCSADEREPCTIIVDDNIPKWKM